MAIAYATIVRVRDGALKFGPHTKWPGSLAERDWVDITSDRIAQTKREIASLENAIVRHKEKWT
jgi:hypothetical protein